MSKSLAPSGSKAASRAACAECKGSCIQLVRRTSQLGESFHSTPCESCGGSGHAEIVPCTICGTDAVALDSAGNPACDGCLTLSPADLWSKIEAEHYGRPAGRSDDSGARLMPGPIDVAPIGVGDMVDLELRALTFGPEPLTATG